MTQRGVPETLEHTLTHSHRARTSAHAHLSLTPHHSRSHACCTLTLTGSALGRQRMSGGALTLVAPVRVGAGTSPAQQRVPRTLVHVCACARESGCEGTDQGGRGVARGKLLPAVPSPVTLATAGRAWRLGLDDPGSGVCAGRSRGRSAQEGSWNPQENQGHEADTPRVTEGGPEKQPCRTPQGGKVQASPGAGCATPRLKLQSRVPPSTPQAHPRAFAPAVSSTWLTVQKPLQSLRPTPGPLHLLFSLQAALAAPLHHIYSHSQPQPQGPQNKIPPGGPHSTLPRGPLKCFSQWPFCISPGINFINICLPIRS